MSGSPRSQKPVGKRLHEGTSAADDLAPLSRLGSGYGDDFGDRIHEKFEIGPNGEDTVVWL